MFFYLLHFCLQLSQWKLTKGYETSFKIMLREKIIDIYVLEKTDL